MAVFNRLPEEERMGAAQQFCEAGGREGREALQGIAVQDASEKVRKMAKALLKPGAGIPGP